MQFPAKPEISETKKEDATTYKATATKGQTTYFVGFTVHQTQMMDHQELAQVSLDAFAETLGGIITEQSDWKYKKNLGRQAVVELKEQDARVDYKVILVDQIQYQLVIVSPKADHDAKVAKKFFKSFKMKK